MEPSHHMAHSLPVLPPLTAELPTLLVFPYFMESHVSHALPSLIMSDYQVLGTCTLFRKFFGNNRYNFYIKNNRLEKSKLHNYDV